MLQDTEEPINQLVNYSNSDVKGLETELNLFVQIKLNEDLRSVTKTVLFPNVQGSSPARPF